MFREKVEAKYQVVQTEVTADWKDIIKKTTGVLLGAILFSNAAMAFNFNGGKLKAFEKEMQGHMHEYSQSHQHDYDFKINTKQKGDVQNVHFDVYKDGKLAGSVIFTGDKDNTFNKIDGGLTSVGHGDDWVKTVVTKVHETVKYKASQAK